MRSVNEARLPVGLPPRDDPAADELIYRVPAAGLLGDLPGSTSVAEEEREMVPLCLDQGVGLIPWSPLARGHLARPPKAMVRPSRSRMGKISRLRKRS